MNSTEKEVTNLGKQQIRRYSRQLILPEMGMKGQLLLANTSVLIVGAGGLGCPAATYLAAAGVGVLGIVDYDEVEISNLHRQFLHTEDRLGVPKSQSIVAAVKSINSNVQCRDHRLVLDSSNAAEIINQYDIVLDCTDNVATRYLLNDCCVLCDKPLVSGSALRFEGQLTVYNFNDGPCYRCLYPTPPPPETVTNCSDGCVLGVVPGIIGSFQALEALKIACKMQVSFSEKLLLFDALDGSMRTIKLRPKQKNCAVCGVEPSITKLIDYVQFCGAGATDKSQNKHLLTDSDRISVQDYKNVVENGVKHVLIDVRQPVELEICRLPNSYKKLETNKTVEDLRALINEQSTSAVYVVCRLGNDSQVAVQSLRSRLKNAQIKDIKGGLHAWAQHVDQNFPVY